MQAWHGVRRQSLYRAKTLEQQGRPGGRSDGSEISQAAAADEEEEALIESGAALALCTSVMPSPPLPLPKRPSQDHNTSELVIVIDAALAPLGWLTGSLDGSETVAR